MNTKLFVGNLSFKIKEAELEELFAQAGSVVSVAIPLSDFNAAAEQARTWLIAAAIICAALGFAVSLVLSRLMLGRPLHTLVEEIGRVARGQLDDEILIQRLHKPHVNERGIQAIGNLLRRLE